MLGQEILMGTLLLLSKERLLFPVFFLLQAFLFLSTQFTLKGRVAVKKTCSDMPRLSLCPAEGIACMSKNRSCLKLVVLGLVDQVGLVARVSQLTLSSPMISESCEILNSITVHRLMKCP